MTLLGPPGPRSEPGSERDAGGGEEEFSRGGEGGGDDGRGADEGHGDGREGLRVGLVLHLRGADAVGGGAHGEASAEGRVDAELVEEGRPRGGADDAGDDDERDGGLERRRRPTAFS